MYGPLQDHASADVSRYLMANMRGNAVGRGNATVGTTSQTRRLAGLPGQKETTPAPDGTYPYDGGPKAPIPMPKEDAAAPRLLPLRITSPATERFVSLQLSSPVATKGKWVYPAYGEQPRRTGR